MIQFGSIPNNLRKPGRYLELNTALAVRTLPQILIKMLIVAQKLATGTVAQLVPTALFSDAEAGFYFGLGSVAHLMVRAAIKANPYIQLTVIGVDDAAGVAATGTLTITGPATGSGIMDCLIGDRQISIAIANGDAQNALAAALNTALGKIPDLPLTAAVAANVITFTARNKGTLGNKIPISVNITAPGVAGAVVAMANGATDPTITAALATVQGAQFHIINTPFLDATNITALKNHLDFVSGPMEQKPATAILATTGTYASAAALAINHGRIMVGALEATRSLPYEVAAGLAAVAASETDPAMPLNTLQIRGILPPALADRFTRTEQEALLYAGITPLEVGPGEVVQIVRAITTYTTNAAGVDDPALLDYTTIRSLDYGREAIKQRIALRFPRAKLSSRTPGRVWEQIYDVMLKLEELEIWENVAAMRDALIVERNTNDVNRLDAQIPADVVNGLHIFAGRIDLYL